MSDLGGDEMDDEATTAPVRVGDVLAGKYAVERVIGAGGMGVVVAARHLQLKERVAIKFLLPNALAIEEVVERFLMEGQAAARIRSEHVARVHDVGTLDSGAPFLVMEYLDGHDLGQVLKANGPLPVDIAIGYLLQACEAVAEAHSHGMVHRDLKPANLFLTRRTDGSPVVKVIDFGITKVGSFGGEGESGITKSAVMMGSPLFMAPEQMASARDADARSDIWSVGVILHTLISGNPPFAGSNALEVFEQMMKGAAPLRTLRPDVPEGVEQAVLRCLRRDRVERFNTLADLADALLPFAPAYALVSVERIGRLVRPRGEASRLSAQPISSAPPAPSASVPPPSALPGDAQARVAAGSSAHDSPSVSGPTSLALGIDASASRRSPFVALIGVAAAIAIASGVGWLLFRGSPDETAVVAAGPEVTLTAPAATELAPLASAVPIVSPSAPAQEEPAPTASTSAASSAVVAPPAVKPPPSPPRPGLPPAPKPKPTTGSDAFSDPR